MPSAAVGAPAEDQTDQSALAAVPATIRTIGPTGGGNEVDETGGAAAVVAVVADFAVDFGAGLAAAFPFAPGKSIPTAPRPAMANPAAPCARDKARDAIRGAIRRLMGSNFSRSAGLRRESIGPKAESFVTQLLAFATLPFDPCLIERAAIRPRR
jgi:hypothetical protein